MNLIGLNILNLTMLGLKELGLNKHSLKEPSLKTYGLKVNLTKNFALKRGFIVLMGFGLSSLVYADNEKRTSTTIDVDFMATAYSPAQPIKSFINDWEAPLDSGDYAFAQGRFSINVKPNATRNFSYGLGWRYDYLMEFNEETALGYWQYKNDQPPASSQRYPLYIKATHNERVGANVGYTYNFHPNWQFNTHINAWQGLDVLQGDISGDLFTRSLASQSLVSQNSVNNTGDSIRDSIETTQAEVDYYYTKPALGEESLNWNPSKPNGYGYSIDASLVGKISDNTELSIRGYDLLGRMHWNDMPSTQYSLDYDIKGRPIYQLEGQLSKDDIAQTLPWRVEGEIKHQLNDQWQLGLEAQGNEVKNLYQLTSQYRLDKANIPLAVTGIIEPQTKSIGFGLDGQYGGIKVLTDDLNQNKAKRSEISVYGQYSW